MTFRLRSARLTCQILAKAAQKWTYLKIVAYHKSHTTLQQYQCPAVINVYQQIEGDEGDTHYGV
jgi:hypothetical protein